AFACAAVSLSIGMRAVLFAAIVFVMAGLVPAIHVWISTVLKAWMPGTRPGMTPGCGTLTRCRLHQPFGRGTGFSGDLGAGQHARDLLAALVGGKHRDAGGHALALVECVLGDQQMLIGACSHLRRMRHRNYLHL